MERRTFRVYFAGCPKHSRLHACRPKPPVRGSASTGAQRDGSDDWGRSRARQQKNKVEEIRKRQLLNEKTTARIAKEVNSMRVAGKGAHYRVAVVYKKMGRLAAQDRVQLQSQRPHRNRKGAARRSGGRGRMGPEPEEIRTTLVSWPFQVGAEHMRAVFARKSRMSG